MPYYLPVVMIVLSNVFYNICTKSLPAAANPFLSLVVTYMVGAGASLALFFLCSPDRSLAHAVQQVNWAPVVLGLSIVGLEAGYIFLYRAGWKVSMGSIVCNSVLAIVLIAVGVLLYHEKISVNQAIGMALCAAGLVFINR